MRKVRGFTYHNNGHFARYFPNKKNGKKKEYIKEKSVPSDEVEKYIKKFNKEISLVSNVSSIFSCSSVSKSGNESRVCGQWVTHHMTRT